MGMLDDKVALVTGAGGGIGLAIARAMAREGAAVVVSDFNAETGQQAADSLQALGAESLFVKADVSREDEVAAMVAAAVERFGRLDVACNSAALSKGAGPIHTFSREVFDETVEMCMTSSYLCLKHEVEQMLAQQCDAGAARGSIVNISSNAALRGQPLNTAYAAAKGGVNILTQSAAAEYGPEGIRINAISPGVIRTPGVEKYFAEQPKIAEHLQRRAVLKRLGQPEEIAEAVVFLLSERASYITGQVLSVDGGSALS